MNLTCLGNIPELKAKARRKQTARKLSILDKNLSARFKENILSIELKAERELAEREGAAGSPYRCWTRTIWDVTVVGWLLNGGFMQDALVSAPIPQYDHHYSFNPENHLIRCVYHIERDRLFEDLFRKLSEG